EQGPLVGRPQVMNRGGALSAAPAAGLCKRGANPPADRKTTTSPARAAKSPRHFGGQVFLAGGFKLLRGVAGAAGGGGRPSHRRQRPPAARAQQSAKTRVGITSIQPRTSPIYAAFDQRLRELGYIEGQISSWIF